MIAYVGSDGAPNIDSSTSVSAVRRPSVDAVAAHQRVENLAQRRRPDLAVLVLRSRGVGVVVVIYRLHAVDAAKTIGAERIAAVLSGLVGAACVPIGDAVRIAAAAEARLVIR